MSVKVLFLLDLLSFSINVARFTFQGFLHEPAFFQNRKNPRLRRTKPEKVRRF